MKKRKQSQDRSLAGHRKSARERIRDNWPKSYAKGTVKLPCNMRAGAYGKLQKLGVVFKTTPDGYLKGNRDGYVQASLPEGWELVCDVEYSDRAYLMNPDDIIAVIEESECGDDMETYPRLKMMENVRNARKPD